MNVIIEKIKSKNLETTNKPKKLLVGIELVLVFIGVILLMIDSDMFLSVSVLLIFVAIVLGMVSLFLYLLNASKNQQQKIKNSIDIVYKDALEHLNLANDINYQVHSDAESDENWILIPSFANKSIHFELENGHIKMFHAEAFNKVGADQRRTYYFKGLYIIMNGLEGNLQYRDKETFSEKVIESLKELYRKDENDIGSFTGKTPLDLGTLYANKEETGRKLAEELLRHIRLPFVSSVRIGLQNHQLHIAVTQKSIRLPYIKTYQNEELENIKRVLSENVELLEKIQELVSKF